MRITFNITKRRMAAAVAATVIAIPTVASATHVFGDVDDGAYYAAAVEWAADEGITQGTGPNTFSPTQTVDRGQMVTFLKRMNDNVVDAVTTNLFASDAENAATTALGDLGLSASVTIPEGHTGVIEAVFSAESACYGGTPYCIVGLARDGVVFGNDAGFAFDSTDSDTEDSSSWEGHSMTRVTEDLPAGTYVITAESSISSPGSTFRLDDMVLTAQVHLTS